MRIASDQVRGLTDKLKRVESDKWRSSPKSGRRAANVSKLRMHALCSTKAVLTKFRLIVSSLGQPSCWAKSVDFAQQDG